MKLLVTILTLFLFASMVSLPHCSIESIADKTETSSEIEFQEDIELSDEMFVSVHFFEHTNNIQLDYSFGISSIYNIPIEVLTPPPDFV